MQIKELKNNIDKVSLPLIFQSEKTILVEQYIDYIANSRNLEIKYINSLNEIEDSLFDEFLYVYYVDTFNNNLPNKNLIVVCNKTNQDCVKFPKIEKWMLADYLSKDILTSSQVESLLISESSVKTLEKLKPFDAVEQQNILGMLIDNKEFEDDNTIFDLSNAIIHRDIEKIKQNYSTDINPMALQSLLYTNFKNILQIQTNPKCTAEQLGVSEKQFYVLKKYNTGFYTTNELIDIIEKLSNFEYMMKFGGLDDLLSYLLVIC